MPDFLTRRHGTWHFVRRVPTEFSAFDHRGIIKHSTKVRIADDRNGRRASRVADKLNRELENYWRALIGKGYESEIGRYELARQQVRALGFDLLDMPQLIALPPERTVEHVEALAVKGLHHDPAACAAVLGAVKRPVFPLSRLQQEHEAIIGDEIKDKSPEQMRIWRTERIRCVQNLVSVVGDKLVTDLTEDDGVAYVDWWRERVVNGETNPSTGNKDIGQLSRMLKDVRIRKRHKIPDIFKDLRLREKTEKSRIPFENEFIQYYFLGG
jgi:hypothetical protein